MVALTMLHKRLKGATIVEAMMAMVIIMLSSSAATIAINNVVSSISLTQQTKSRLLLESTAQALKTKDHNFDTSENFEITQSITNYQGNPQLKIIYLQSIDKKGKVISERKEIVYIP